MSTKLLSILCSLCVGLFAGCSKSASSPTPGNGNSPSANTNSAATTSNSSSAGSAEKVGVPECDEFIAKYEACISDHVPDARKRTQYQENINALRNQWRQLANTGAKDTLVLMCQRHVVMARESMKSFNCVF